MFSNPFGINTLRKKFSERKKEKKLNKIEQKARTDYAAVIAQLNTQDEDKLNKIKKKAKSDYAAVIAQLNNPDDVTLGMAASKGQINLFRARHHAGKDNNIQLRSLRGEGTPAHYAAAHGQDSFLRKFVQCGGNLHTRDGGRRGSTPLGWALESSEPEQSITKTIQTLSQLGLKLSDDASITMQNIWSDLPAYRYPAFISKEIYHTLLLMRMGMPFPKLLRRFETF